MKHTKGFTLVELVIVIVIVGILSIVAVPIYRGYTRRAMGTEGKSLLGSIQTSQKVYYAENSSFFTAAAASSIIKDSVSGFNVDARGNKYFKKFTITGNSSAWTASTSGEGAADGLSYTITGNSTGEATILENDTQA